jgi:hypothetical protein
VRTAVARAVAVVLTGLALGAPPVLAAESPGFRNVAPAAGLDFVHSNGAAGTKQCPEQMGSGVCLLDYDGDGLQDVYLVTSVGPNRLYRNLGGMRFSDVTDASGLGDSGYGMAAVAADTDNDGDPDVLVTNFGGNRFYENHGDGTFRDITDAAGLGDPRFGCGAAFLDLDRDGWLDLYVTNYVQVAQPDTNLCYADDGKLRLYCPPRRYPRERHLFYRNRGDGTFEDRTEASGVAALHGRGLGVVATDFDRDGWVDIYVANDLDANFLYRNRGDGTLEEVGLFSGASHSEDGAEESGMGVASGDYDNDGWIDLFVTNFINETNTLYHNEGDGFFLDESATSGVGPSSLPYVGWGTQFFDYDRDGWLDLLATNGHTESDAELSDPTTSWKQPDFLYRNRGDGTFEDVTGGVAPELSERRAGRGAAFGDLDNDGDMDFLINNQNGPVELFQNDGADGHHWIGFRTVGGASNRDGSGARVELWADGFRGVREVHSGSSYLSSNDPRVLFGLGERAAVDSVVVIWPTGVRETHTAPAVDRYHTLQEGK